MRRDENEITDRAEIDAIIHGSRADEGRPGGQCAVRIRGNPRPRRPGCCGLRFAAVPATPGPLRALRIPGAYGGGGGERRRRWWSREPTRAGTVMRSIPTSPREHRAAGRAYTPPASSAPLASGRRSSHASSRWSRRRPRAVKTLHSRRDHRYAGWSHSLTANVCILYARKCLPLTAATVFGLLPEHTSAYSENTLPLVAGTHDRYLPRVTSGLLSTLVST